jgi:integrase/recombinase XerD
MQTTATKLYTEPKISPARPKASDMQLAWYVWFRFFDASSNSWKQLRFKKGINEISIYKDRLAEANALKQAIKEELQDGWNPLAKDHVPTIMIYSLEEAINYILKIKSATLKIKTRYAYTYIIGLFLEWLKAKNLSSSLTKSFTGAMAQEYMDWMLLKKGYSGRTFNDHLIVLRTFFNCFMERDWILKNPFRTVKRKTQTIGRNLAYTDAEKSLIEKHLYDNDRRLYYFTQFIYHCFIRRTEMTSLKIKHIDLVNKTIVIPGENAKNKHQESVVIPRGLESVIEEMQLHRYSSESYLFGRRLLTCEKQYKNPNWISTRHNEIIKKIGIDQQKGLYSWKHTGVCNYYYATGKDLYALMRQLRHRDISTTQISLKSMGLIQNDAMRNALVA